MPLRCIPLLLLAGLPSVASDFVYVGEIGPDFVLLAWGNTSGTSRNTVGRDSEPVGRNMEVRIADRAIPATRNWVVADQLQPDTLYEYSVWVNGSRFGGGAVRTWPRQSRKLVFFVLGDWGDGEPDQYRLGQAMLEQFRRDVASPVRFVLSTGDNIYRGGSKDVHWERKFFQPYRELLPSLPFYATLGNHDGNEATFWAFESRRDLPVYLDNFFFPGMQPPGRESARYYRFSFGGLADFLALDTTDNTLSGPPRPNYGPDSEQDRWLRQALQDSRAPWKIVYLHHPFYSAGPQHFFLDGVEKEGRHRDRYSHWVKLFAEARVPVVFAGHEHNFQFSSRAATQGVQYVVSGAGGALRPREPRDRGRYRIQGWGAACHFLRVEVDDRVMRIHPLTFSAGPGPVRATELKVVDPGGVPMAMPLEVRLP